MHSQIQSSKVLWIWCGCTCCICHPHLRKSGTLPGSSEIYMLASMFHGKYTFRSLDFQGLCSTVEDQEKVWPVLSSADKYSKCAYTDSNAFFLFWIKCCTSLKSSYTFCCSLRVAMSMQFLKLEVSLAFFLIQDFSHLRIIFQMLHECTMPIAIN